MKTIAVKTRAEVIRAYNNKTPFEIVYHFRKPEFTGQIRVPNVVQTNAMYSVIQGDPNAAVSLYNNGKGSLIGYGKASDYEFLPDGSFIQSSTRGNERHPIWRVRFVEE